MRKPSALAAVVALVIASLTAPALAQKPVKLGVLTPLSPPGDPVAPFQAYSQVMLLGDALNAAKGDRGEDLVAALLAGRFEGWNNTIVFTHGEGPYWQQAGSPILITQFTRPDMRFADVKIIFPAEFKTGEWMPRP